MARKERGESEALQKERFSNPALVFGRIGSLPAATQDDHGLGIHRPVRIERRVAFRERRKSVCKYWRAQQPQRDESNNKHGPSEPLPPPDQDRSEQDQDQGRRRRQNELARHGFQDEHGRPTNSSLTFQSRSATTSDTASARVCSSARRHLT